MKQLYRSTSIAVAVLLSACAVTEPVINNDVPQSELEALSDSLITAELRPRTDDLPGLRTVDPDTGAVAFIFYESEVEELARNHVPFLVSAYKELARLVAVEPGVIIWSEVAFVQDPDWVPPRHAGEIRWSVVVDSTGKLGPRGQQYLYSTVPHEQIHEIQATLTRDLPRWFSEGQADWAGLQVTSRYAPELAIERRAILREAFESLDEPVNLSSWGGVTVKREAILRQVRPEQRSRMEADPGYTPPGPFSFGPDDLLSDEAHTVARYGGSLALFEMLEKEAGRERMLSWFQAVWQANEPLSTEDLIRLAELHIQVDLRPWFAR